MLKKKVKRTRIRRIVSSLTILYLRNVYLHTMPSFGDVTLKVSHSIAEREN